MIPRDADRRAEMPGAASSGSGRNPREDWVGASRVTARSEPSEPKDVGLMDAAVERENMVAAWRRVKANRGAAGVDAMTVEDLEPYLEAHWPRMNRRIRNRTYGGVGGR